MDFGAGAFETGKYPNFFGAVGLSGAEVDRRIERAFETIFFDPEEKFYHDVDGDCGCMEDTGNVDARTEGMSYGMMMCVQMDRRDLFDRLWRFSRRYMLLTEGPNAGYFAWSVQLNGKHNAEGPAPDGEEYFAMALFMADGRWGSRGEFDYAADAREILRHCVHQKELIGGEPMWNPVNRQIKFVPGVEFTDPSYHLPHFYTLFAQRADEEDRPFWREAAEASRAYIALSAHPVTGLSPEYASYDGTPILLFGKPWPWYSDAYRVMMNIGLDSLWFGRKPGYERIARAVQQFLSTQGPEENYRACMLDGTRTEEPAMHPTAITACCAASVIAGESEKAADWLRRFAELPLRRGKRRYYDNCLYFFCLLMLGGRYRIY
ncbi:MAG: xylanase [Clostridiales bacterium]|nr:xylanase [Clostridiales bacterium]